jgi:hypothetical protein
MSKATDLVFRTIRLPESLQKAMRSARDVAELTNEAFVAQAIEQNLPRLIDELTKLGFGTCKGKMHPTRLPFSDKSGTLSRLRKASNRVELPMTQLLAACLLAASSPSPRTKRKRSSSRKQSAKK